jgi:hypothetical protein
MSELLTKFSYSFDAGDGELNKPGVGLSAATGSVTTPAMLFLFNQSNHIIEYNEVLTM